MMRLRSLSRRVARSGTEDPGLGSMGDVDRPVWPGGGVISPPSTGCGLRAGCDPIGMTAASTEFDSNRTKTPLQPSPACLGRGGS